MLGLLVQQQQQLYEHTIHSCVILQQLKFSHILQSNLLTLTKSKYLSRICHRFKNSCLNLSCNNNKSMFKASFLQNSSKSGSVNHEKFNMSIKPSDKWSPGGDTPPPPPPPPSGFSPAKHEQKLKYISKDI